MNSPFYEFFGDSCSIFMPHSDRATALLCIFRTGNAKTSFLGQFHQPSRLREILRSDSLDADFVNDADIRTVRRRVPGLLVSRAESVRHPVRSEGRYQRRTDFRGPSSPWFLVPVDRADRV